MKISNAVKRISLILVVALAVLNVNAQQKGDMAVGGDLVIGTGDSYTNVGLSAKFQYNVIDPLRLEGSFTYFFKKDYMSMWDMSANAHYLFNITDQFILYPLAGIGVLGVKVDLGDFWGGGSVSDSYFAFNIGGGAQYKFTENWAANFELKYKIADNWDRFLISAGVTYKF